MSAFRLGLLALPVLQTRFPIQGWGPGLLVLPFAILGKASWLADVTNC